MSLPPKLDTLSSLLPMQRDSVSSFVLLFAADARSFGTEKFLCCSLRNAAYESLSGRLCIYRERRIFTFRIHRLRNLKEPFLIFVSVGTERILKDYCLKDFGKCKSIILFLYLHWRTLNFQILFTLVKDFPRDRIFVTSLTMCFHMFLHKVRLVDTSKCEIKIPLLQRVFEIQKPAQ